MRNGAHLIAYASRLGGRGITGIEEILDGPLCDAFTGVHVLPFYTPFDGADAGFDPADHTAVDPRLGTWDDVSRLSAHYDVTADVIVNHISTKSREFIDFAARGADSPWADLFVDPQAVFSGEPTDAERDAIYRPRPTPPFTRFTIAGEDRLLWTTFTPDQVDIDIRSDAGRAYLGRILDRLSAAGVSQVRLDAVGYAVKTRGTNCFMTPETVAFIDELSDRVHHRGMEVLVEVHAHYETQLALANRVDRVYDFALPPLVLHTIYTGSTIALRHWLAMAPRNAITVLDTHDGIGVIDVAADGSRPGLLTDGEIEALVDRIHTCTNDESRRATGEAASNLDLYQVNTTLFSALGRDHDAHVLARMIQLMAPGIPHVYYAGLLAARNDMALLAETGVGRDINRPFFTVADVEREIERPCVARVLDLLRLRSTHRAFGGAFTMGADGDHLLEMAWVNGPHSVEVTADVREMTFEIRATEARGGPR